MTDSLDHPYVELIAREARRPVAVDPGARDRVMAAIRAEASQNAAGRRVTVGQAAGLWARFIEPRAFRVSPVASTLLAAGLVGVGVALGVVSGGTVNRGARKGGEPEARVATQSAQQPPVSQAPDTVAKFVFVDPSASHVSLVGDFNGWDLARTPMVRAAKSGLWTVTLPMKAGRHLYAFVVDGSEWTTDPGAPVAPDDGYGKASSVKIVRGPAS